MLYNFVQEILWSWEEIQTNLPDSVRKNSYNGMENQSFNERSNRNPLIERGDSESLRYHEPKKPHTFGNIGIAIYGRIQFKVCHY